MTRDVSVFTVRCHPFTHYVYPRSWRLLLLECRFTVNTPKWMQHIFSHFPDVVEPLSLDEAFLDVSESNSFCGRVTFIEQEICRQVGASFGIQVSAGVSSVKFLAIIARDWQKPNAIIVIQPEMVAAISPSFAVKKLPGVGPVMANKYRDMVFPSVSIWSGAD